MTPFGRQMASEFTRLVCLDSTHKTTQYGYSLFTLMVQDNHGQGVPLSYFISNDEDAESLRLWLEKVKNIAPHFDTFMTDNDDAEIAAVASFFPESRHLLCWWHVLRACSTFFLDDDKFLKLSCCLFAERFHCPQKFDKFLHRH